MKIYELPDGEWVKVMPHTEFLVSPMMRQIDPDPTFAHSITLDSCTAVITADSCYFKEAAFPVLTLEEMQRVTKCMEMLRDANQTIRKQAQNFVNKHFKPQEKTCDVCNAENCIHNETCIQCGCQM